MATTNAHTAGMLPSINDLTAIGVMFFVYVIRIASLDPQFSVPWYLTVSTDLLIPTLAAMWLWVSALYVVVQRFRQSH